MPAQRTFTGLATAAELLDADYLLDFLEGVLSNWAADTRWRQTLWSQRHPHETVEERDAHPTYRAISRDVARLAVHRRALRTLRALTQFARRLPEVTAV